MVGSPVEIAPVTDSEARREQTALTLRGEQFVVGDTTYRCADVVNAQRLHTLNFCFKTIFGLQPRPTRPPGAPTIAAYR